MVIKSVRRLAVFPNSIVRALDAIASTRAAPMPLMSGGMVSNVTTVNQNRTYGDNNFFGGVQNDAQIMQRLALLRAMGR